MGEQRGHGERRDEGQVGRRKGDTVNVTREEFDELRKAVLSWANKSVWILRGIVVVLAFVAFAGYLGIKANQDRTDDIDASRRDSIVFICQETNDRHDNSLQALDVLSQQSIDQDPARADEIRQSTEAFKVFVEALVPKRDCESYADAVLAR